MKPYFEEDGCRLFLGDAREVLPSLSSPGIANSCVTSPPYFGLRDYRHPKQIGNEPTLELYLANLADCLSCVWDLLRSDGTLWLNLGDSYARDGKKGQHKPGDCGKQNYVIQRTGRAANQCIPNGMKAKDMIGVPWATAFMLRARGWYLRSDIIWHKPNVLPESVTDRPTKTHEYIFLLSKSARYYYNQEAILEPVSPNTHARLSQNIEAQIGSERANGGQKTNGNMKAVGRKLAAAGSGNRSNESFSNAVCCQVEMRNKRTVWTVPTGEGLGEHTSTYPEELIKPCILAGSPVGGLILDPFCGTGTTLAVAKRNGCSAIGVDVDEENLEIAAKRLSQKVFQFEPSTNTGAIAPDTLPMLIEESGSWE